MSDSRDAVKGGTERTASTIELFFDLVYVFAVTQVTALIRSTSGWLGLGRGALMLWFLWWTWSIYTWTTNWTGTASKPVRLFLLAAMGGTLFMARAVPDAFDGAPMAFAAPYFVVRLLVAGLYWTASKEYPTQRAAFYTFFPLSFLGASTVLIGGFLTTPWQGVLWSAAAVIDMVSAAAAGRGTWAVDARHFAERNGLFVIIALGESIVGIGLAATGVDDTAAIGAIVVSFVGVAALWWSYFDKAAPKAERYFRSATGQEPGRFARDAYTLLHYPLVVGIVLFAVEAEEVVAHPSSLPDVEHRLALAAGIALVLLSIVAAVYRAVRRIPVERLIAALVMIVIGLLAESMVATSLMTVLVAVMILTLVVETVRWNRAALVQERG